MRLKLITYNIWHGTYLDQVTDFLKSEQPDIICLQEVATKGQLFRPHPINLYAEIKKSLKYHGHFMPFFEVLTLKGSWNIGTAVLSRHPLKVIDEPFIFDRYRRFTDFNWDDMKYKWPRGLLGVDISLPQTTLPIWTTHFTITPQTTVTPYQLASAQSLKTYLKPYHRFILAGDMNTLPETETYRILSLGLTDLSSPQTPTLHPTIHPVGDRGFHVDYVFTKGPGISHLNTQIPLVDASDHLPVVVELDIES